jgi:2,3-bisphosphoglycerate-dependent phosphoglycerate mutase
LEKKIYVNRHYEAEGQSRDAQLTERGVRQAEDLAEFLAEFLANRKN